MEVTERLIDLVNKVDNLSMKIRIFRSQALLDIYLDHCFKLDQYFVEMGLYDYENQYPYKKTFDNFYLSASAAVRAHEKIHGHVDL